MLAAMQGARPRGTKLLVATLGLCTVSYVGCGNSHPPGNLMQTPPTPTEHPPGNLMAPPDEHLSTEPTAQPTAQPTALPTVEPKPPLDHPPGNLMPPPPPPPPKQ